MRHNDARKWLHAVLDLLPVILIPVFMIYSHRHSMTEQTTVDIQYKYQSNEVNSYNDLLVGNVYHCDYLEYDIENDNEYFQIYVLKVDDVNINDLTINWDGWQLSNYNSNDGNFLKFEFGNSETYINFTNQNAYLDIYFEDGTLKLYNFDFYYSITYQLISYLENNQINITSSNFNIIESVDVHDETSNIMNVFMDNFNNTVNKYFNMGNIFNMGNVYQWFETNIFGGNAPVVIYSVWNIVLYEFVMDLLFLLYGLFMWFIDICKHLMEKPFRSIK